MLASRLSDDPSVTVLLLEKGGMTNTHPLSPSSIPALASIALAMNNSFHSFDYGYTTEPHTVPLLSGVKPGAPDRRAYVPRGKGLGGSNEVRFFVLMFFLLCPFSISFFAFIHRNSYTNIVFYDLSGEFHAECPRHAWRLRDVAIDHWR